MLLDYAQYIYLKKSKEVNFTSDFTDLIASVQRFMLNFDCQLNQDEVIKDIPICDPIYKKMCDLIRENL